jgi:general secretion pathway protein L
MKTLTVALPSTSPDAAAELAFVLSFDGKTPMAQGRAPLALLPKADAVQLVVPMAQLAFHRITIPKAPKGKLWSALVGVVEESLLLPLEDLAMALQPDAQPGTSGWVASFGRSWALAWVETFERAQHHVHRLLPQLTPREALTLSVVGELGNVWLVKADAKGVISAPLASSKWLAVELPPEQPVACSPELSGVVEGMLARPLDIQSAGQLLLASAGTSWDLAQFDLRVGRSAPWRRRLGRGLQAFRRNPEWRWTRWGLAGLITINLIGLNLLAFQERAAVMQKKEQQVQLFKKTFPKVTTVRDAPVQMTYELDRLRQSGSQSSPSDLEYLLATLGQAQPKDQLLTATQLNYQDRRLTLSGFSLQHETMSALKSRLDALGQTSDLMPTSLTIPSKNQP